VLILFDLRQSMPEHPHNFNEQYYKDNKYPLINK
jgi:hypothetical protein